MASVFTTETPSFGHQLGTLVVCKGTPGTGTSRGKIHGIVVFGKTLTPLVLIGAPIGWPCVGLLWGLSPSGVCPKNCFEMEPFLLLTDGGVNPFLPGTRDKWFISDNIAVEFRGKAISEVFDGAFFVKSHSRESGQSFKFSNILINFTALHADFFDILLG